MYLTTSKRFETSFAYRYYQPAWTVEQNRSVFGAKMGTAHGYGANGAVFMIFHGAPDPAHGMTINVARIKEKMGPLLAARYDHKFLNVDTPPFDHVVPTPENIAQHLLLDASPLFAGESARLVACHFASGPKESATAYHDGVIERDHYTEFSAARRTFAPALSVEENERLFGVAAAPEGHGHHYRLRATVRGTVERQTGMVVPERLAESALNDLFDWLDHRNLAALPELSRGPLTTEHLARLLWERLNARVPVHRVRLWENPAYFAEYWSAGRAVMGIRTGFRAAHRLHSRRLSQDENAQLFGKCNNPAGHGHRYEVEVSVTGALDPRSGTIGSLTDFQQAVAEVLAPWHLRHLDDDTDDFSDCTTTGENIITVLWSKLEGVLGARLYRLRLWETPNNRFTLRREVPAQ